MNDSEDDFEVAPNFSVVSRPESNRPGRTATQIPALTRQQQAIASAPSQAWLQDFKAGKEALKELRRAEKLILKREREERDALEDKATEIIDSE